MKKFLINIRGVTSAGKTTMVRQFCEQRGFAVEMVETPFGKLPVSVLSGGGVVVLGDYSANGNCLGVDRYENGNKDIIDAIIETNNAYHPNIIIYEHMLSSAVSKGTCEIAEIARLCGFEYLGVQLSLSEEERFRRLISRSGKNASYKQFNKKNGRAVERATDRLRNAGLTVVVYDVENRDKNEMWRILDDAIRKALA